LDRLKIIFLFDEEFIVAHSLKLVNISLDDEKEDSEESDKVTIEDEF